MVLKFNKQALKFIDKMNPKEQLLIKDKINLLLLFVESQGIIPFKKLNIKNLTGQWKGFMRMRIGKVRIIFRLDIDTKELFIYEIDYRGRVYK